jgi:hypothetical protein
MAYGFPVGYQPYYQNAYSGYAAGQNVGMTQQVQYASPLIWVQGEAGAKSYLLAPGNTVALWDSESQTIFLKSADASGMPSMRVLEYTIREDASKTPKTAPKIDFATKDDVFSIQKQIDEIKANLSGRKGAEHESTVSADESGRQ